MENTESKSWYLKKNSERNSLTCVYRVPRWQHLLLQLKAIIQVLVPEPVVVLNANTKARKHKIKTQQKHICRLTLKINNAFRWSFKYFKTNLHEKTIVYDWYSGLWHWVNTSQDDIYISIFKCCLKIIIRDLDFSIHFQTPKCESYLIIELCRLLLETSPNLSIAHFQNQSEILLLQPFLSERNSNQPRQVILRFSQHS